MKTAEEIPGAAILPHREPFLFLDRIVSYDARSSVGLCTFERGWHVFRGHFPGFPVVPGVILLEAMCQSAAAGVLAFRSGGKAEPRSDILMLAGVDKVRFRRPVRPGETLETHAEVIRLGHGAGRFHVRGLVGGELAAEADIFCVEKKGEKK